MRKEVEIYKDSNIKILGLQSKATKTNKVFERSKTDCGLISTDKDEMTDQADFENLDDSESDCKQEIKHVDGKLGKISTDAVSD